MRFKEEADIFRRESNFSYDEVVKADVYEAKKKKDKVFNYVMFINNDLICFIKKPGFLSKEKTIKYHVSDLELIDEKLTMFTSRLTFHSTSLNDDIIINFHSNMDAEKIRDKFKHHKKYRRYEHVPIEPIKTTWGTSFRASMTMNYDVGFSTFATGMNFEGRSDKFNRLVKKIAQDDQFFDKYEGLTGRDLKEELEIMDKIYEYPITDIPGVTLVKEDDNPYDDKAIKVMIDNEYINDFHVGYIPKKHNRQVRDIMDGKYSVRASASGGSYKALDYDGFDEERIKTFKKRFYMDIRIFVN